jgi:hypothetical protein
MTKKNMTELPTDCANQTDLLRKTIDHAQQAELLWNLAYRRNPSLPDSFILRSVYEYEAAEKVDKAYQLIKEAHGLLTTSSAALSNNLTDQ